MKPGFGLALAVLATGAVACNLVDDEPEQPAEENDTEGGSAECLDAAEQLLEQCLPPQQLIAMWDEGNSSMVLIDDPAASVGIGPGGWLVQVSSSADYVGTYHIVPLDQRALDLADELDEIGAVDGTVAGW